MTIEFAREVGPDRVTIAYERLGDRNAPAVLLIMGLGAQLITWPDGLCAMFVERGFQVIRFDNRDVGESTHFSGVPNFMAAMAGDFSSAIYTLSHMAADTAGLLDALGLPSAHVIGASLGGYVAQTLAIEHTARVRSLTSIMSSTGDRSVGQPHPIAMQVFAAGTPTTRDEAIARARHAATIFGSPAYPPDLDMIAARAARAYDRSFDPPGMVRQAVASMASGDRTPRLRTLRIPTLVIHGTADVLVDPSGGRATAAAIPGAELMLLEGMGHDLPAPLWPELVARITANIARS